MRLFLAHAAISRRVSVQLFAFLFPALCPVRLRVNGSRAIIGLGHYLCWFHKMNEGRAAARPVVSG